MEFVDVFLRQAHPGEDRPGYQTYAEKVEAARRYKREEALPWTLLVDDIAGTVHRAYSEEMADPVFLIDTEGIISFYGMWTHVPTLHAAIETLLANGGRGVSGGLDRKPHLLASFVDGYRGPRRGGRRAVLEYDLGALGAGTMSFAGNQAKSVLGPWPSVPRHCPRRPRSRWASAHVRVWPPSPGRSPPTAKRRTRQSGL